MRVFDIVLLKTTIIYHLPLCKVIGSICFLHKQVSNVLFVFNHSLNCSWQPRRSVVYPANALLIQPGGNFRAIPPFEEFLVDTADDHRLRFIDYQIPVGPFVIAHKVFSIEMRYALLEFGAYPPACILGNVPAFLLGQAA